MYSIQLLVLLDINIYFSGSLRGKKMTGFEISPKKYSTAADWTRKNINRIDSRVDA
jgi:hypothetical protein